MAAAYSLGDTALSRTIVVIGNGPSLKGFDFHALAGVDTIGMNAAYRHWDRINWYPTYYTCLDDQLIQTHHTAIKRMVERGQVRAAFLHGSFFALHPECVGRDGYWSFDQFSRYWFEKHRQGHGFEFVESAAFASSQPSKVTTGSHAVRFAAHLGYERIGLIGIDLKYVEILPGAVPTEGVGLLMSETPPANPNYFFDDYQRAGDRYNIPNPDVHDGRLHLDALLAISGDFAANGVKAKVVNCNIDSVLFRENAFSYTPLLSFAPPVLGAVVVPCNAGEKDQIISNLRLWSRPEFAPFAKAPDNKPALVFVFNNDTAKDAAAEIEKAARFLPLLEHFSRVETHFLDLTGDRDAYVRDYSRPAGEGGYKAGPNNQFFGTMRLCQGYGRYIFLMESDCIPIRPDWLGRLCRITEGPESFFILGSAYRGEFTIGKEYCRHINGNAVYAVGDPEFQRFIDEFWQPNLDRIVSGTDPRIAYDCALEMMFTSMNSLQKDDAVWSEWKTRAHKFRHSTFIQNISAAKDLQAPPYDLVQRILRESPETFVIHSQVVAKAAAQAVDDQSPSPERWEIDRNAWPKSPLAPRPEPT